MIWPPFFYLMGCPLLGTCRNVLRDSLHLSQIPRRQAKRPQSSSHDCDRLRYFRPPTSEQSSRGGYRHSGEVHRFGTAGRHSFPLSPKTPQQALASSRYLPCANAPCRHGLGPGPHRRRAKENNREQQSEAHFYNSFFFASVCQCRPKFLKIRDTTT